MDIESELPSDFEQLSDQEKVSELEELLNNLQGSDDSARLKKRIVEELIRKYSD